MSWTETGSQRPGTVESFSAGPGSQRRTCRDTNTDTHRHTLTLIVRRQGYVFSALVPQSGAAGGSAAKNRSLECSQHVLLLFCFFGLFFFSTPDEGFCFVESRARTHNVRNKTQTSTPLETSSAPLPAAPPTHMDLIRRVE